MKKILFFILFAFILLVAILLVRTFLFTEPLLQFEIQQTDEISIDTNQVANHLAKSLQFQTVSYQDPNRFDGQAFLGLQNFLEEMFPQTHQLLKKEIINKYSLLYEWAGSNENLQPILLMAHQDVVPISEETQHQWTYPPFDGKIAEGFIWGRGTMDVKCGLMGILEAVESLVQKGFQPQRTLYLAFGHDEEVGGLQGAAKIAELIQSRNIQLEFVLDEGGVIVNGIIPGVSKSVALIGLAEKGYLTLELKVETEGGHSSIPPKHTAVGILSKAITDLENNPFPSNMKLSSQLFEYVGPYMPFFQKMIFANMWLTRPLIEQKLSDLPAMNANIRTTTAATMFKGSPKENVLPKQATAIINIRIMPGESVASVIEYVKKIINNPEIEIKPLGIQSDPPPISAIDSKAYEILKKTIYQTASHQELVIAPFLVIATTDSRHFINLAENIYRFIPIILNQNDLNRVHGLNERISIENYVQIVKFYYQFIKHVNLF